MKSNLWQLVALILVGVMSASSYAVEDITATARSTADKASKAIITIKVVLKLKQNYGGQTREFDQKLEVTGTVIDASGLTVAASSALDPTAQIKASGMPLECEVKETTLLLEDGTEVEADVVLKDTDLDLGFLKPREAERKFEAVAFDQASPLLQPLDRIFVISRLGKLGNRSIALTLGTIKSCVKGPKPFYVCDNDVSGNAGCVAYSADGKVVGLMVTKVSQEPGAGRGGNAAIGILRPLSDVLQIAQQAKQAKSPVKAEEKKEEPKEANKEAPKEEKKE